MVESACSAGDLGSIPGLEDPLEKEMAAHPSILAWKNLVGGGAWQAIVHGVAKSDMTERTCPSTGVTPRGRCC